MARSGVTDPNGEVRFAAVRPGTYRLRFEGEKVITFEREVTDGGAQPPTFEVSLSPAPPPPPPPPAPKPEPAPAAAGANVPPPEPKTVGIPEFVERNLIASREPSKTHAGRLRRNSVTNLIQIRDPLKDQVHAGRRRAALRRRRRRPAGARCAAEVRSRAGTFSVVPRGTTYTLQRRGNAAA